VAFVSDWVTSPTAPTAESSQKSRSSFSSFAGAAGREPERSVPEVREHRKRSPAQPAGEIAERRYFARVLRSSPSEAGASDQRGMLVVGLARALQRLGGRW
jgi:hypothetical protein